jgi:hypothetical protein|tara:strand:- start:10015 stop:10575 length:561 start_codon:yes stop_codon:yes gene_type:complete
MAKNNPITCDIDGVLNFYPQMLIDYAQDEYKISISDLPHFKSQYIKKYTEIKSAYRYSSYKHEASARSFVVDKLNVLSDNGYDILILTTRPFDRFPGMYELTLKWLESIGLKFSTLQSKTKSNIDLIKPIFHIDDRLDHILEIYCPKTTFLLFQGLGVSYGVPSQSNIIPVTEHTLYNEIERLIHD